MRAPDDFTLGKCLHADARCEVYAAVRDSDGRRLALKYYNRDRLAQARSELAALTALAGRGIVRAQELLESPDGPVLALDQIDGLSLREWVDHSKTRLDEWQKQVDSKIRTTIDGISQSITPWASVNKDVRALADRISELEAKLRELEAHEDNREGPAVAKS